MVRKEGPVGPVFAINKWHEKHDIEIMYSMSILIFQGESSVFHGDGAGNTHRFQQRPVVGHE